MDIRFYRNHEIDKKKWDELIHHSVNTLIYATSVYLDHMCPGWCALIDEETQSVMPLPIKKKMGITYSYQPPFTQQLGVFSKLEIDENLVNGFLQKALIHSQSISLYLNYKNYISGAKERCNYILDLSHSFTEIKNKFRKDLITKPGSLNVTCLESNIEEVFLMYRKHVFSKTKKLSKRHLLQFENLCKYLDKENKVITKKVISEDNEVLSSALFFIEDHRIYYMMSASSEKGKRSDANAFLLYEVIRGFSGQQLIFDFEGSEIPGVKSFFKKFGPIDQAYFHFESENLGKIQSRAKKIYQSLKK